MISSIVGTGSLAWGAGSGLISQHKPVNLPYSFKLSYSADRSAVLEDREIATYFFGRGNISPTASKDRDLFDFLFLY